VAGAVAVLAASITAENEAMLPLPFTNVSSSLTAWIHASAGDVLAQPTNPRCTM
jgi:hypothetical protein